MKPLADHMTALFKQSALGLGVTLALCGGVSAKPLADIPEKFAKNVIVMIPDGMSASSFTLTRWVHNDGKPMHLDPLASGLVRTHTAMNPITDSAPAATAIATGYKTEDKIIGLKPSRAELEGSRAVSADEAFAPAASVLEAAKLNGLLTGLIATSEIMHATPAGFSAHSKQRSQYNDISEQQVYQHIDVVFGGGRKFLTPPAQPDNKDPLLRIDNENMFDVLKSSGYDVIDSREQLTKQTRGRVWGIFADADMQYEINRPHQAKVEPSLGEMTHKAIELLSKEAQQQQKGFFLMVEGSKIDWVAHSNSVVTQLHEIKAFDDAVKAAVDFAKTNQDTLVVVMTDHGNGGLSIGNSLSNYTYSSLEKKDFVELLRKVHQSDWSLANTLSTADNADVSALFTKATTLTPTTEELSKLTQGIAQYKQDPKGNQYAINNAIADIINNRANIAMTTNGHTGEDVPFYVYTSKPDYQLTGVIQNSDIAHYVEKAIGVNLDAATKQLFVPESAFEAQQIKINQRELDPKNTFLTVSVNDKNFTVPENKNYVIETATGTKLSYNGVNVFNEKQFFIPQAAIDIMRNAK
ncbi:MAG: alkaline phosphatase [Vibrionaceae bacterium]